MMGAVLGGLSSAPTIEATNDEPILAILGDDLLSSTSVDAGEGSPSPSSSEEVVPSRRG